MEGRGMGMGWMELLGGEGEVEGMRMGLEGL